MLALSTGYPNQKFVLFKKLPDGRIRKVETFTEPISREQAISMYGSDHYMLQSMKPRTRTIWNDLSAYSKEESEKNEVHVIELQRIDRKTNYLTGGLVGLGIASAIGFGATAVTLLNNNQLLTRATMAIDGLMSSYPIPGFLCGTCRAPLVSVFAKYCNQCGYPITSPDRRQLASATEDAPTAGSPLGKVSTIAEIAVSLYRMNPLEQVGACHRNGTNRGPKRGHHHLGTSCCSQWSKEESDPTQT